MSILMKKPRIEEIADALGDAKKTLLGVLDGPGEYARFDLEKGPLPVGGAPLVRRSILSYKGMEYPGVYLRTSLGSHFIEVSGKEECATYEVDEDNRSLRKVDEPLTAEELRRVLGGGSGGGSELPDGYSVDGAGNVTIAGAITANKNGNVEVHKNLNVDGNASVNTLPFRAKDIAIAQLPIKDTSGEIAVTGLSLPVILIHCHSTGSIFGMGATANGVYAIVRATITAGEGPDSESMNIPFTTTYVYNDQMKPVTTLDEALAEGHLETSTLLSFPPVTFDEDMKTFHIDGREITEINIRNLTATLRQGSYIDASVNVGPDGNSIEYTLDSKSEAKYQHTVILSGGGFEFCFTAPSSKNMVVDSYQDLGIVFGGERIGLIGYSSSLSAKPVFIDLHGGTVATDFIRVFEENGNTFANHTLSSLGAITFSDDVYIPN